MERFGRVLWVSREQRVSSSVDQLEIDVTRSVVERICHGHHRSGVHIFGATVAPVAPSGYKPIQVFDEVCLQELGVELLNCQSFHDLLQTCFQILFVLRAS